MDCNRPLDWIQNNHINLSGENKKVREIIPEGISIISRRFHRQVKDYKVTPLKGLGNLASMIGLGGIWVKDEALRLTLNSFKVLGGSFALYRILRQRLGIEDRELTLDEIMSNEARKRIGKIVFAAATDGNHGRGVAWGAGQLGYESIIYVHKATSPARIKAIEGYGAKVKIIDGTYDDAVRQVNIDAEKNGWQVVSDTSWEGYEDIPKWVMQGYTTLFSEAQEQLSAQGFIKPTHIFVQAGVGALAASFIGYYYSLFGEDMPISVVVEPEKAACLYDSMKINDGKPHLFEGDLDTIMAGLACGEPSPIAWEILLNCAHYFLSCPDFVAAKGMRVYGVPVEGDPFIISGESGGVTLGALMYIMENPELRTLREQLKLNRDSQVLLINTEGSTDPMHFRQIIWEGSNPVPEKFLYAKSHTY